MTRRERAAKLLEILPRLYPGAHCELVFQNPLELLVATILSAQCTDKRVNLVTPALFQRCRSAADYAKIPQAELEGLIRSTGFFRNKAKNIRAMGQALVQKHGGQVPRSLEELAALPGVGRKTANVVLGNAFGINEGVVVDTHIGRLSRRLGLSRHAHPEKVEADLARLFPRETWTDLSHWLIAHGRRRCTARRPDCQACELAALCPSAGKASRPGFRRPPPVSPPRERELGYPGGRR
ncbi:MAG: endonuclease III [Terrimicrobiaceae bacterium]|nr:endonuclease III [Terrimicrobiaceae bacterium]